jgi:hypothetical protein
LSPFLPPSFCPSSFLSFLPPSLPAPCVGMLRDPD